MRRMKGVLFAALALAGIAATNLGHAQCKSLEKPAKDVKFTKEVKATKGAVYLATVSGGTTKPDACGLKPTNAVAELTGWGGPLDTDNASIGEGIGTRNFITIGGIRFERGVGTHAPGKLVYDISQVGAKKFHGFVGLDDEKDGGLVAPECGNGGSSEFIFTVDGKEMFKSGKVSGVEAAKQVDAKEVSFDIPSGAKEFIVQITDGGDGNSCDHADLGDPKLMTAALLAVQPKEKLAATWAELKNR